MATCPLAHDARRNGDRQAHVESWRVAPVEWHRVEQLEDRDLQHDREAEELVDSDITTPSLDLTRIRSSSTRRYGVPPKPSTLEVREVAADLRIGKNQAYELVKSGALRSVKIGRTIRVPVEALSELKAGERAQSA
jgi:excisionase family DNA binding protein